MICTCDFVLMTRKMPVVFVVEKNVEEAKGFSFSKILFLFGFLVSVLIFFWI